MKKGEKAVLMKERKINMWKDDKETKEKEENRIRNTKPGRKQTKLKKKNNERKIEK